MHISTWLKQRRILVLIVFLISAGIYAWSGGVSLHRQSFAPHYVYLADAFLHGRLELDGTPPNAVANDWTYYRGKWHVSFPPLPAILMMPFVALTGKEHFNDLVFTLIFGALNVALMSDVLPRAARTAGVELNQFARVGLTALFGFGTVHWWVAVLGQVWFTAQIIGLTLLLLALEETFGRRRPVWVCTWVALSAACRPNIGFALPALAWLLWVGRPARHFLWGLIPFGLVGLGMGWLNRARFGSPLDFGYAYMDSGELVNSFFREHGQFNLYFLGKNIHYAFLALPEWSTEWPFVRMNLWGMSMFLSTPALVYAFVAPWRTRVAQGMALGTLLVATPLLFYYNTGYGQAGYRYILDVLPFLMILIALGIRGHMTKSAGVLIIASILMGYLSLVNFTHVSFMFDRMEY